MMYAFRSTPLLLCAILLISACSVKKDDPAPADPAPAQPPPAFSFTLTGPQGVEMTLDGAVVKYIQSDGMFPYHERGGVNNEPPAISFRNYSATMHDIVNDRDVFTIRMGSISYTGIVEQDPFEQFFAPGTRQYGSVNIANIQRVQLEYQDVDGNLWTTSGGMQDGSNFEVTASAVSHGDGYIWAKVIGSFNCTLRNSSGASKTVTNGRLMFEFQEIY